MRDLKIFPGPGAAMDSVGLQSDKEFLVAVGVPAGAKGREACLVLGLALLFALPACSKNPGGGGGGNLNNNQNIAPPDCPEGTLAREEACVPSWDQCPLPDEIPLAGGGCRAIGVERCDIGGGCGAGFVGDGEGGCEPVRPATSCADGALALLGQDACQEIRHCGAAPWGNVSISPGAVFVDASYAGGPSDGSASAPFVTIGEALAVLPPGGQILLAQGTYAERINLSQPVIISGRCPSLVTIQGVTHFGQGQPGVLFSEGASGSVLQGVRVTGPGHGVVLNQAVDVRIQEVEVLRPEGYGVLLQRGARAEMRRVKVKGARTAGLILYGGLLQAEDTVVSDTDPSADGAYGRGVDLGCDHHGGGGCAALDATALVVERSHEVGIFLSGGSLSLVGSLVADTRPNAIHGQAGLGIHAQCDTTSADCPQVTVLGSVVSGNRGAGILGVGADLLVADTVVRDTLPHQGDQRLGMGLVAQCDPNLVHCAPLSLTCSVIARNHQAGLALMGVQAQVEAVLVMDTEAQASSQQAGDGVLAQCEPVSGSCSDATLENVALLRNTLSGLFVHGARVRLEGSLVAENRPVPADLTGGYAVYGQCDNTTGSCADIAVEASLLQDHRSVGITLFGGQVLMYRSAVLGVLPQLAEGGSRGFGLYADGRYAEVTMDVEACEIGEAVQAGAFLLRAAGSMTRSWVHGGEYSVILDDSHGFILDGNLLAGSERSEPLVQ